MSTRIVLTLAAAAALVACTGETKPQESQQAAQPVAETKAVTVKGSDTMVILAGRLAENYMKANPGKTVQVTGGGSGTGIAALINGTTDIANASRPMKPAEKDTLQQKRNARAVEHRVALDGLAIFVNDKNPMKEIGMEELAKIYLGQVKNWKEVGGPDAPIVLYGRENSSGTYAYFKEHVLKEKDFAAETQTLPGTAAVVNAVGKDPNAIGYGGIAYGAGIRAIPVKADASSPAVEPTMENVTSGTYPLSRYLFMYTAGEPSGTVKDFITYAQSEEGQKVVNEVGYYPLPRAGAAGAVPVPEAPAQAPAAAEGANAGAR